MGEIDLKAPPPQDPLDPQILKKIDDLLSMVVGDEQTNRDLAREMIVTALKSVKSKIDRGDMKLMNRSMRELRYAFKVLGQYRDRRKVTVFGSARTTPDDPVYRECVTFARKLQRRGFMVVTGAGPGIMEAGNQGAGRENSIGINIRLPFEQEPNRIVAGSPRYVECRYFFTRKLLLAKEADAGAFFAGGFGTQDEAFELLTLIQTGKAEMIPVVMVDVHGGRYWRDWKAYVVKDMLKTEKISAEDMHLFKICQSADEACKEIFQFYRNYHSMRYVHKKLVLRVLRAPEPPELRSLEKEFKDIIVRGPITVSEALPEEREEEAVLRLPRVIFEFDRMHYGRLRQLINRLNEI
jgi:uncharacterized protein (TIGR00730 family)